MRTVEPLPAQVACMNKGTVLRLLGLLSGGNVLQRGKIIDLGLSRWVWGLLAKLPDRGELNSEEIGVIRELGKKAVLVGLGLKDETTTKDDLDELNSSLEQDEEVGTPTPMEVINDEEINLDDDLDLATTEDVATSENTRVPLTESTGNVPASGSSSGSSLEAVMTAAEPPVTEEGELPHSSALPSLATSNSVPVEDLIAAKERLMEAFSTPLKENNTSLEEEVLSEDLHWNTKATVDIILTVAGEIYGQRDLLEFRGVWGQ
jgi:hypothetical protein